MSKFLSSITCSVLLAGYASAAPASRPFNVPVVTNIDDALAPAPTLPYASDNTNNVLWAIGAAPADPQPIRDTLGATILGPQNVQIDQQNPDLLAPPTTDAGTVGNAKWPMSLSHNRLQTGGWARQQNIATLPMATSLAGVNMRLEAGAIRELHWHSTAEWAYILSGSTQVTAVNADGENYLATVGPGDLWYFPPGVPHSLQATADNPDGTEFLLVFDDGSFSEDATFLLTDWMAHLPKEVLAKNFQTDESAFAQIPGSELYIFPSQPPSSNATAPASPQGQVPSPFTYKFSEVKPQTLSGGSVKIADSSTFNVSTAIAVAEVTVEPGAMRELHWHPTQDEWGYFLEGQGRVTLFASSGNSRTFNFQAGDVSFIPASYGHYVENTGNSTLRFLEIFNSDRFQDISLSQWLASIPPELVKAHLQLPDNVISNLNKTKQTVVGPVNATNT